MKKTKRGRPPKKKVLDSFSEEPIPKEEAEIIDMHEEVVPVVPEDFCECGKPMHPEHRPHCWDCSHRA